MKKKELKIIPKKSILPKMVLVRYRLFHIGMLCRGKIYIMVSHMKLTTQYSLKLFAIKTKEP